MSNRKPFYLACVILLAVFAALPQLITAGWMAPWVANRRLDLLLRIPGIGETLSFGNELTYATYWHDRLIAFRGFRQTDGTFEWKYPAIDPETGESNDLDIGWSSRSAYPRAYGHRLFLAPLSFDKGQSVEIIDGQARPSDFRKFNDNYDTRTFLFDGEPAEIQRLARTTTKRGFPIRTFRNGAWKDSHYVDLPGVDREWTLGSKTFHFLLAQKVNILQNGDETHVFLCFDGFVLYRNGLKVNAVESQTGTVKDGNDSNAVTATTSENVESNIDGWYLAGEAPNSAAKSSALPTIAVDGGMIVGKQPAVLLVEQVSTGYTIGSVFRFDGDKWSLFATLEFPFGSTEFRTVAKSDGETSYIVATTSMGVGHVYAVEGGGIRPTPAAERYPSHFFVKYSGFWGILSYPIVFELIPLLCIGLLMWRYSKSEYQFGHRTVRLASLGRRLLARTVDLSLVAGSAFVLAYVLTSKFDWMSCLEALNLKIDHPTVNEATRIVTLLVLWIAFAVLVLIVMQGRCGMTPGKWCCGLRVVRTDLRSVGISRSLAREVMFAVDTCNLMCWMPGVLSIAFTDARQRLGDLVADTIVCRRNSLGSASDQVMR